MDYFFVNYGLILIAVILTLGAQLYINSKYKRTSKIMNEKGITGAEVARQILANNDLNNIQILKTSGTLSDFYDPKNKVIKLSDAIYEEASIASASVAAHECGHAIQDKNDYTFLRLRRSIIPLVNFASYAGYIAITLGIIFSALKLIWVGILMEVVILAFQLITLPVEFNASKRALQQLEELNLLNNEEIEEGKGMLTAAALTYVASAATALIQILRLVLIFSGRRRND